MAKTMDISNKKEKIKIRIPIFIYPIVLILSFIISFIWGDFSDIPNNISLLAGTSKNNVIYETYTVSISDDLEEEDINYIKEQLGKIEYNKIKRFEIVQEDADINIGYSSGLESNILYSSYLIPVGHIYWIDEDTTLDKIKNNGIYLQADQKGFVSNIISTYANNVKESDTLISELEVSEEIIGFIDILELEKNYKVLKLDNEYFFDYPDKGGVKYSLGVLGEQSEFIKAVISKNISENFNNRGYNPELLSKVNMTGVTAIVRSLASKVNTSEDNAYPAELIGEFLADADLTHVSNEISFVPGCIPSDGMRFCSHPNYIEALEASGVDIVELTGNHNNDFGASYNTSTIETYVEKDWDYFGGGLDDADAAEILYKEVNGSTIAFLGYNYYDTMQGTGAIATSSHAGANSYSSEKLESNISEARDNADVVIVDFQFQECYSYPADGGIYPYCYKPLVSPPQEAVFKEAIDFGADIVIGTQAHQPQTYELYENGIIFYGLGNLYFDQIPWIGTRHGLVLSHYFYDGKYINTQMTTTNYGNDMQTYISEGEERELLLNLLKDARD